MKHKRKACTAIALFWLGYIFMTAAYAQQPPELRFEVKRFTLAGEYLIAQEEAQKVLKSYVGKHSGMAGLQAAADALEQYLAKHGFNFHRVILPPQTLDSGVVRLEIVQFRLGKVAIENNKYFTAENIRASLPELNEDQALNTRYLTRSLLLANTHPAKKVELLFKESEQADKVDAHLKVKDSAPASFFSVLQNTGTEESGDLRLTGGFQYGNVFNRDHGFTATYTTAPDDTDAVSQFGLNYRIPFYKQGGALSLLYSDSDVDSGVVQELFEVSGRGSVFGARYDWLFLNRGAYRHSVDFAYYDKQFENDARVRFVNQPIGNDVRSNPLNIGYSGSYTKNNYGIQFSIGFLKNLPRGDNSDDAAYAAVRNNAVSEWAAWRYSFSYQQRFSGWLLRGLLKGQSAGEPLISGEQFGLGGMQSVRGFEERAVLGDNGWQSNLELWSPPLGKFKLRPLFFYDFGSVDREDALPGEVVETDIASAGLALQWAWRDKLSVRADAATVLEGAGDTEDGDNRLHLSIFYRF